MAKLHDFVKPNLSIINVIVDQRYLRIIFQYYSGILLQPPEVHPWDGKNELFIFYHRLQFSKTKIFKAFTWGP